MLEDAQLQIIIDFRLLLCLCNVHQQTMHWRRLRVEETLFQIGGSGLAPNREGFLRESTPMQCIAEEENSHQITNAI